MAVPGAAEEILVRYCIASGATLIFARSARAGASCQMVPNMLAALDVVRKLMTMIQLSWSLLRKKMPGESDSRFHQFADFLHSFGQIHHIVL
jgi:hypothetical protein